MRGRSATRSCRATTRGCFGFELCHGPGKGIAQTRHDLEKSEQIGIGEFCSDEMPITGLVALPAPARNNRGISRPATSEKSEVRARAS